MVIPPLLFEEFVGVALDEEERGLTVAAQPAVQQKASSFTKSGCWMLEPMMVTVLCSFIVSLVPITMVEEEMLMMDPEDWLGIVDVEDPILDVTGATGLGSSEQPKRRVDAPMRIKERRFFFMISKYSLQKGIVVAKTFLLSLESL
jgi:hypothetical protein